MMKFNRNNKYIEDILKVVDTLNTMNGGMVSPVIKMTRSDNAYRLVSKVPGVDVEDLRVEVVNKRLMIYHLMKFEGSINEQVPNVIHVKAIPDQVDIDSINAYYDEGRLIVEMPFEGGSTQEGYHRSIDINLN